MAEKSILIMGGIFILAMECMNTAIERVVDDISEDKRDLAKQAKDTASAAVAPVSYTHLTLPTNREV